MGVAALPQHYDYYGAYAEEGSGWRLGEGRGDVAKHDAHPYHAAIDGELTFGWPASFALVAEEGRGWDGLWSCGPPRASALPLPPALPPPPSASAPACSVARARRP